MKTKQKKMYVCSVFFNIEFAIYINDYCIVILPCNSCIYFIYAINVSECHVILILLSLSHIHLLLNVNILATHGVNIKILN